MFKSPHELSVTGNAATAASAAATSAATAADKAKMCASSIIFRGVKWCFYLVQ